MDGVPREPTPLPRPAPQPTPRPNPIPMPENGSRRCHAFSFISDGGAEVGVDNVIGRELRKTAEVSGFKQDSCSLRMGRLLVLEIVNPRCTRFGSNGSRVVPGDSVQMRIKSIYRCSIAIQDVKNSVTSHKVTIKRHSRIAIDEDDAFTVQGIAASITLQLKIGKFTATVATKSYV